LQFGWDGLGIKLYWIGDGLCSGNGVARNRKERKIIRVHPARTKEKMKVHQVHLAHVMESMKIDTEYISPIQTKKK